MKKIFITELKVLQEGKIRSFKIEDKQIAVVLSADKYHVFDAYCTHEHCSLAGGDIYDDVITCYCHGAQFNINTGKVESPPAEIPLKIYQTEVSDGKLYIMI
jgi:3-phenylpropionate/trans-cinnamate dioxygenase ferredoxin subunit